MFNNRWVVIGLCIAAVAMVGIQIIGPLLGRSSAPEAAIMTTGDDEDWADEPWTGSDDWDGDPGINTGIDTAVQGLQLTVAQRDLKRIDVAELVWNAAPSRDPFARNALLATAAIQAVQASAAEAGPVTPLRQAIARPWPTATAVVVSDTRRYAVFGSMILEPGARFDDFEVRTIEPNTVVLRDLRDNRSQTIRVVP
ncbi:MAG: hypothetical protein AAGF46_09615 [Pseudomonadota bacterium]